MGRPYSKDLRERVVSAVESGQMSRNQAARHYGVAISTAIIWVRRFRQTGNVAPGKMGGHKPKSIRGAFGFTHPADRSILGRMSGTGCEARQCL
jgi:putative transposase